MNRFFFFFLAFLMFACKVEVEKPDNLMSRGAFKQVLTDLYLYRQANLITNKEKKTSDKDAKIKNQPIKYEEINAAILQKHGISYQQFKDNFHYYLINDKAYDVLLTEIRDSLEKTLPKDFLKQDSLNKINKPKENEKTNKQERDSNNLKINKLRNRIDSLRRDTLK